MSRSNCSYSPGNGQHFDNVCGVVDDILSIQVMLTHLNDEGKAELLFSILSTQLPKVWVT